VDGSGNVYVTGRSVTGGGNTTYDIVTVKYNSAGVQQWVNRYDRAGLNDIGLALALDITGSPIVAGIENNGTNTDGVSIKYDSATGNRQWVGHYDNGLADSGRDVMVDGSGNVYLSGWSQGSTSLGDYIAIKYASQSVGLANGSGRAFLTTGENVMIGGFIIGGNTPRTVLVQARGPGLGGPPFNLPSVLANPTMQLYSYDSITSQTLITQNDDWQTTDPMCNAPAISCGDAVAISATGKDPCQPNPGQTSPPPNCALESSILVTLPPGAYTSVVRGVNNGVGLALVGVFDTDTSTPPKFINVSARAPVGTGSNALIGGFIIREDTGPQTVFLRARGPTIGGAPFFLPGVLANPTMKLYSFATQTYIAENDNWQTTLPQCDLPALSCGDAAAIAATGLDPCQPNPGETSSPPGCAQEPGILVTLPPGAYTAVVTGVGGTTGLGLVEIDEVSP
jgi:hypothetical protein